MVEAALKMLLLKNVVSQSSDVLNLSIPELLLSADDLSQFNAMYNDIVNKKISALHFSQYDVMSKLKTCWLL